MNTSTKKSHNSNFIYALGLICLMNILSSELTHEPKEGIQEVKHIRIASDCNESTFSFI